MQAIQMIAVGKLKIAGDNVRQDVGDVSELAASIKSVGVLEPLLVREGDQLVVAGSRRLAAAKKAGMKEVPAIVRPFTEQERVEVMVIENLQREDLTPFEEAAALQRLVEFELSQREIAARVGRSQAFVSKRLALLELPEVAQEAIGSGKLTLEGAQELARVSDNPKLVAKLVKEQVKSDRGEYAQKRLSGDVQRELEKRKRDKKVEAAMRKLEKAGEKVVKLTTDTYGYSVKAPKGKAIVRAQTVQSDEIEMGLAAHRKLACHAVGVDPRTFATLEVCTDPGKHETVAGKRKSQQEQAAEKAAKAREAWDATIEARRGWLAGVVKRAIDKDVLLELCYLALDEAGGYRAYGETEKVAVELLGEQVDEDDEERDAAVVLSERAAKSAADRLRVTFAIAAGTFESNIARLTARWSDNDRAYFELLVKLGHKPSKLEKEAAAEREPNGLPLPIVQRVRDELESEQAESEQDAQGGEVAA